MKFSFNKDILGIDGKALMQDKEKIKMNDQLGNLLVGHVSNSEASAVRYYEWALALKKGESIDLNTTDQKEFRTFIGEHKGLSNLVKAQISLHMDATEKAAKK